MVFALAGCGGGARGGGDNSFTMAFGNLLAYNTTTPPPVAPLGSELAVECPAVNVEEGQSAYRSMAGAEVRYQFSLGDLARECRAQDGTVSIRVGVSGYLLAGQAGASGTFSVPVRIVVRSQADERVVASRVMRVSATIPQGETQATFAVVADPLTVPYLRPEADQDYAIFVSLDPKGAAPEKPVRSRRKRG
jgi:hypothetical protein